MSSEAGLLRVTPELAIPLAELEYRASRSGGPGGQHVNTTSTRIELLWHVADSPALTDAQRALVCAKLAGRIDSAGVLRVVASVHRSQFQNRQEATDRLRSLLAGALRVPRRRRKTKPPPGAREARLRAKRRRSELKGARGRVAPED